MREKVKVIIFGTGIEGQLVENCLLPERAQIVGYIDNNVQKHNKLYHGRKILFPNEIQEFQYDCVILSMHWFHGAYEQLINLEIPQKNIIIFFQNECSRQKVGYEYIFSDNWRYIAIEENFNQRLRDLEVKLESRVCNLEFEIYDKIGKKQYKLPSVITVEETISRIANEGCSFARFGDGEFKIMLDLGEPDFQSRDAKLSQRLAQVLVSQKDKLLIGIPDFFGEIEKYDQDTKNGIRKFLTRKNRKFIYDMLNWEKEYFDSYLSRPYIIYEDKTQARHVFDAIKRLCKNREIVVVEGNKTRMGVGNDLFSEARSVERILVPNENAFAFYDQILEACSKVSREKLFILAVGPTATVLAYDLEEMGYQAMDIGHLDNEYEWFLRKATERVLIPNKYVNEVRGGALVESVKVNEIENVIDIIN